ncbi:MAG: acetyl-coenzyme A synthetase N-terminal domain-containing protein, partial [Aestuariivirga sp.]
MTTSRYRGTYERWQADPHGFWEEAAGAIDWVKRWDKVQENVDGLDRWYAGA